MFSIYSIGFILLWVAFWGYWYLRAFGARKGQRVETNESRVIHYALLGLTLLLFTVASFYPLNIRLYSDNNLIFVSGFVVAFLGFAFAIWARSHLGQYWSGAIIFQRNHKLIQSGPYALTRHPIYTGILVGMFGTAIAIGEVRGFIALGCAFVAYYRKMRMEESWLARQFGDEYAQYQKRVRMVVPFVV
jgi:protein-S-isoprenylcysteine O-methyltransferase Ste14